MSRAARSSRLPRAARAVLLAVAGCTMCSSGAAAQGSVATDRTALEALYDATGGADWTDGTNWKTAVALDDWFGVTTDDAGRVTALELGSRTCSSSARCSPRRTRRRDGRPRGGPTRRRRRA